MGLGSVVSGAFGVSGSKKAYKAMLEAQKKAREEYQGGYDDISSSYQPYLEPALQAYQGYAGVINGDPAAFNASPWGNSFNQYAMDNTINQLQGTAAAKGSMLSGNTLKELQTNIQSILSNDYLNRLNNYLSYAGNLGNTGVGLTQDLGQYRWNLAQNNANSYLGQGAAKAAQQIAKYNSLGQVWGGLADNFTLTPKEAFNASVQVASQGGGSGGGSSSLAGLF